MIYDDHVCILGEGPLWHPEREELFWFDILGKQLRTRERTWQFETFVSAAGWVDADTLIIASARGLHRFDIVTGANEELCALESGNPITRSNDGRADPQGGFWIGTMGIGAEPGAGAIYRYFKGELRQLWANWTIPNAICFAPDGRTAYLADTPHQKILKVALDDEGWPCGAPEISVDLSGTPYFPDGAVVDAAGNLWNAQWGANRVACYGPDGSFVTAIGVPAAQSSCPAFGGEDLSTLFVTTAAEGLDDPLNPHHGKTFAIPTGASGQREHRVIL